MKLTLRRIGNSLGVIIPKATLDAWRVGEGDTLHLTAHAIGPPSRAPAHLRLDALKRRLALAVIGHFSAQQIRAQILANLHRWRAAGSWVSAYDEWEQIAASQDDAALYAAMLGEDERATRLRQSAPYVGLLPREDVERLNRDEAAA